MSDSVEFSFLPRETNSKDNATKVIYFSYMWKLLQIFKQQTKGDTWLIYRSTHLTANA